MHHHRIVEWIDTHAFQTFRLTNLLCTQLKFAMVIGSVILGITRVVICKVFTI